ncbi:MAG: hypothetical protein EBV86_17095 [Marivivens sp.]|nr:hypothetical protein [Marivivens sp.]
MLTKNFQQLQAEVASHVKADKVAQGSYQTCFIGCLANQEDRPDFIQSEYGIPLAVSRIAETIFEGLPAAEATGFFAAFPSAVGCDGKNLTLVVWQFLAAELRSLPAVPDNVQAVIDPVIAGMDRLASGLEWKEAQAATAAADAAAAWPEAKSAAAAAEWAARAAAGEGREAAAAADCPPSARSAVKAHQRSSSCMTINAASRSRTQSGRLFTIGN